MGIGNHAINFSNMFFPKRFVRRTHLVVYIIYCFMKQFTIIRIINKIN